MVKLALSSRFVIQFQLGATEAHAMGAEWIEKRFAKYQAKMEREQLEQHWAGNARSQFPAIFESLKNGVRRDAQEYSDMFGAYAACHLLVEDTSDGFRAQG